MANLSATASIPAGAADSSSGDAARSDGEPWPVRLIVGVTGHRNLVPDEVPVIRERTEGFFRDLRERFPAHRLSLLSPLAEGADSIVAGVALDMGIELLVPLPKPEVEYLRDFSTEESRQRFRELSRRADAIFEIAPSSAKPPPPDGASGHEWDASYPYAFLGTYLCAHCHVLLAIWDGKPTSRPGGTGQVVRFHHDDVMPGITTATVESQQMLVDDESDLVYHIVAGRNAPDGEPADGLTPGQAFWFTKDEDEPRSATLPRQHRLIFERSEEFAVDSAQLTDRAISDAWSLLDGLAEADSRPGLDAIDRLYRVADQLAIRYQRRTMATLKATHALAFLTGLTFILYSDLETLQLFLIAFVGFFLGSILLHLAATRGHWHRKWMDYRSLAEGLRVQFYWSAAGVTTEGSWRFAHDLYLKSQEPELGWIRNVMRDAGFRRNAEPGSADSGVEFAVREWVGTAAGGQLGYFERVARERLQRHALTERLGRLSLVISVATVALFLAFGARFSDTAGSALTVVMGASLLLFAVRQGYSYATAVKELMKQYEYMLRIYRNAHSRLAETSDPEERRQVLSALGRSALNQHSDWLLMHRDRLFADRDAWRIIQ